MVGWWGEVVQSLKRNSYSRKTAEKNGARGFIVGKKIERVVSTS